MAVSYAGIRPKDFWDLAPVELNKILTFTAKKRKDTYESHYRDMYESMRLQTLYLVNAQLPGKSQVKSLEALMPLPWDKVKHKPQEVTPFTDEEAEYYKNKIQKSSQKSSGPDINYPEFKDYLNNIER